MKCTIVRYSESEGRRISTMNSSFASFRMTKKDISQQSPNLIHIQKSLVYFQDAEMEDMPRMLIKTDWKEVKRFFETEIKKIAAKIIK